MKRSIFAFIGRAGSGKGYKCTLLEKTGFKRLSFAEPLRRVLSATIGMPYEYFIENYEELKQSNLMSNEVTVRNMLENLATEIRKYDNEFFIKALFKLIDSCKENICIDDLRFIEEYRMLYDKCEKENIELVVQLCDYRSERYQENNNHISAKLSNLLVEAGYKDMDILTREDIEGVLR